MARLPESSLLDRCPETGRGSARAARARADAHAGSTVSVRIQTRGGGEGGVDDRVVRVFPVTNAALRESDGRNAIPDGTTMAAEKFEHFSTQPASFAQPPLACLSQCCPGGQQSDGSVTDVSDDEARALAPATGSMATERAVKATIMARAMLMVSRTIRPPPSPSSDRAVRLNLGRLAA